MKAAQRNQILEQQKKRFEKKSSIVAIRHTVGMYSKKKSYMIRNT